MNDDIVYDLIAWMFDHPDQDKHTSDLMLRACNEIERLREALRRIQHSPNGPKVYCRDGHEEAVLIARAALGEEK